MDDLYTINDTMTALAAQFDVRSKFAADADDEYDEWLNDLTHTVAQALEDPTAA